MKSKISILILLISLLFYHNAQSQVTLTDTVFVDWLKAHGYNQCFTDMQLDTNCTAILNAKSLRFTGSNIHDIYGVQYFKNLDTLNCSSDQITFLAQLPNKLKFLACGSNRLVSITNFPESLKFISCFDNSLTTLPDLPISLNYLDCSFNHLISISNLPDSLTYLDCTANDLTGLSFFPTSLYSIDCSLNKLTTLPDKLPNSLHLFNCSRNPDLKCIPRLTNISNLLFWGTDIACVPNYGNVGFSFPVLDTVPLCDSINPKGCALYNSVSTIAQENFTIHPNPTTHQLTLNASNFQLQTISIYNLQGQQVQQMKYTPNIDVSALSAGMYVLEVQGESGVVRRKFAKE